jgi:hypothetical protein
MKNKEQNINFLCGNRNSIDKISEVKVLQAFSTDVVEFLNSLHHEILEDKRSRLYPDLLTFAFWCRKNNISKFKKTYSDLEFRLGIGVVFHIAPSNVPLNFAYSLAAGLLSGNINIVRLSTKNFEQVALLMNSINKLVENQFQSIRNHIYLIQYYHDSEITKYLSSLSDGRIIWGGSKTIQTIREFLIAPNGIDLGFADRYSICIIDSDQYLFSEDKKQIANHFFNDSYTNDQYACSSPSLIFWLGKNKLQAKKIFWKHLESIVNQKYTLNEAQSITKLLSFYELSLKYACKKESMANNLITRIQMTTINEDVFDYRCGNGFFMEYNIDELEEIIPFCKKGCQTVTYFGLEKEKITSLILKHGLKGCDRIVKIGRGLEFSLVWDGHDLITMFSRKIV